MKTIEVKLSTGKEIEVDYSADEEGRVFYLECFGPGTYAANAGLSDRESSDLRESLRGIGLRIEES